MKVNKLTIQKNWKEITRSSYDKHAEEFAAFTTIFRGRLQKWIDYFPAQLPKGSLILDVGCGAGRDALYLTNKGLSITGIDFSEKLIEIAKKKVRRGKFIVMDFEKLSFPKNSFDGIWASASLYHVPRENLLGVLKKLNLVLKHDGLFFSLYRVGEGEKFTKEKRGNAILERFCAYYKPQEIGNLLTKTGFNSIISELDVIETGDWLGVFARK
ncbi:MAG: class I SAM-dependent methyltransferase [Patescibacteria group bacterium]